MMDNKIKIIIGIFYVFMILVYLILRYRRKKKIVSKIKKQKKVRNYLYPFTILFTTIGPFRKSFNKIKKQISLLYPTTMGEVNTKVTQNMLKSIGITIIVFILILVIGGTNFFYICFGSIICVVLYRGTLESQYENAYQKLLEQTYHMLSIVSHNFYLSNKKVDDAVYISIDECPYEISLHLEKIHKILTSVNINEEVNMYIPICPNRFLLNFVATATSTLINSDTELENGGSLFLRNIEFMKDDLHTELENRKKQKQKFKGRVALCLIPVFLIMPIQNFVNKNFPDMADFYISMSGKIVETLIFITAMIGYLLILNLKSGESRELKEHNLLFKVSKIPLINLILTKEMNRNFTKSQKISNKLKLTGERMGYKQYLLQKFFIAVAMFFLFQAVILFSQWQEKHNVLENFSNSFKSSYITDENLKEEMKRTAELYLKKNKEVLDEVAMEDVMNDIIANSNIKKPIYAELMANEIIVKINKYNNIYYRWYYLLIGIGIMIISYHFPDYLLNGKIKAIKMGMENEVAQFQNIVMLLMYNDEMNLRIILEWMERYAYCFSESIQKCINELAYDEETAIKEMRDHEMFEPFKRFCNNMLIVNEQGMLAAFEEIVKEREHNIKSRATDTEIQLNERANKATFIAMLPALETLFLYIGYPLMEYTSNIRNSLGI